jgi:SAM-dependent methyltransferase
MTMAAGQDPWDEDYHRRGRLWGGNAPALSLPGSCRILELGCGNGKTVFPLVKAGRSVTALDLSPRAASLCRSLCRNTDLHILIGDARQTPFRDASFDIVIASHVAGHLTAAGRQDLASEVLRLLPPGGVLHFRDFSREDLRCGKGRETEPGTFLRGNGIATHYFAPGEVRTLFTGLAVRFLQQHRWDMRVRGTALPRAEIVAEFTRPA